MVRSASIISTLALGALFAPSLGGESCSAIQTHCNRADASTQTHYLTVGNPGSGKSTILNGLAGTVLFSSGPSFGEGKTKELQRETVGDGIYMDTPGLADIELRAQAASAITSALKEGGTFKVFFVLTLEAGRVKPADRTTMELVLQSAPITHYGVIVNKLEQEEYDMLVGNVDRAWDIIQAELINGRSSSMPLFHLNPYRTVLAGKRDKAMPLDEDFVRFIQRVPAIEIQAEQVKDINADEFEAMTEKFEAEIAELQRDTDMLRQKIDEDRKMYTDIIDEMRQHHDELNAHLQNMSYGNASATDQTSGAGSVTDKMRQRSDELEARPQSMLDGSANAAGHLSNTGGGQHSPSADESNGVRYLVVGNPGVGKSAILNSLAGKPLFPSGPSFGRGMTKELRREAVGNDIFFDTPGFADIELRDQSATAITAALKEGGPLKVLFVVTLEAGHLKPADRTTMQRVLESAPITHYGVIINKLEQDVYDMLKGNVDRARDLAYVELMSGLPRPSLYIHLNLHKSELAGKCDIALPLDDGLAQFIHSVPAIEIEAGKVKAIQTDEFEALTAKFEQDMSALQNDKELLQKRIDEDAALFSGLIGDLRQRNEQLKARIPDRRSSAVDTLDEMLEFMLRLLQLSADHLAVR